jgi:uncharacterized membrane protein YuzA (DUF378 family)
MIGARVSVVSAGSNKQREVITLIKLNGLDWTSLVLLIIGGLNWGLAGIFNFNLISAIFGPMSAISRFIYVLVGLSAVYVAVVSPKFARKSVVVRETVSR